MLARSGARVAADWGNSLWSMFGSVGDNIINTLGMDLWSWRGSDWKRQGVSGACKHIVYHGLGSPLTPSLSLWILSPSAFSAKIITAAVFLHPHAVFFYQWCVGVELLPCGSVLAEVMGGPVGTFLTPDVVLGFPFHRTRRGRTQRDSPPRSVCFSCCHRDIWLTVGMVAERNAFRHLNHRSETSPPLTWQQPNLLQSSRCSTLLQEGDSHTKCWRRLQKSRGIPVKGSSSQHLGGFK